MTKVNHAWKPASSVLSMEFQACPRDGALSSHLSRLIEYLAFKIGFPSLGNDMDIEERKSTDVYDLYTHTHKWIEGLIEERTDV